MAVELHRETPLFDKTLNIRLFQGSSESREVPLSLRIIPGTRAVATSGQPERLFHFEVSIMMTATILESR